MPKIGFDLPELMCGVPDCHRDAVFADRVEVCLGAMDACEPRIPLDELVHPLATHRKKPTARTYCGSALHEVQFESVARPFARWN